MKTLGRTVDGNLIVEMTEAEHSVFQRLASAVQGKTFSPFMSPEYGRNIDANTGKALETILMFVNSMFAVNDLKAQVKSIEDTFGISDE